MNWAAGKGHDSPRPGRGGCRRRYEAPRRQQATVSAAVENVAGRHRDPRPLLHCRANLLILQGSDRPAPCCRSMLKFSWFYFACRVLSVWGEHYFSIFILNTLACYWKLWLRALYCPKMSLYRPILKNLWGFEFLEGGLKIRKSAKIGLIHFSFQIYSRPPKEHSQ